MGQGIPKHITDLPKNFVQTPLGQALLPMINSMFNVRSLPTTGTSLSSSTHVASTPSSLPPPLDQGSGTVIRPKDQQEFQSLLANNPAVIIQFSQPTCGPCQRISPEYQRLTKELGVIPVGAWNGGRHGLVALHIDISTMPGRAIAQEWSVSAVPTFIGFCDGKQVGSISRCICCI